MSRGVFVTFEGPEGGGKSTQVRRLAAALAAQGITVLTTREPGGTPVAERIREVLLGKAAGPMAARAELLLMLAARADHVEAKIRPALAAGQVVLCDRFSDSSAAYQGGARGLDQDEVREADRFATGNLVPDLTLLLDVPPELGLARAGRKGGDRIEAEGLAFHRKVRETFLALAAREPARFRVIDATQDEDEVFRQVEAAVEEALERVRTTAEGRIGAPDPGSQGPGSATGSGVGTDLGYRPHPIRVGSDESGKGDYFGPLVVAACRLDPQSEKALVALGVTDSKKLSDVANRRLAGEIRRVAPVEVVAIGPERYNQLYAKFGNLNALLAWAHGKALKGLLTRYPEATQAVSDKFGPEIRLERELREVGGVEIVQVPKGERDPAVAAASIVARAEFLERLDRLSGTAGTELPKGATTVVDAARQVFRKGGEALLARVAKLHFKTTRDVTGR